MRIQIAGVIFFDVVEVVLLVLFFFFVFFPLSEIDLVGVNRISIQPVV